MVIPLGWPLLPLTWHSYGISFHRCPGQDTQDGNPRHLPLAKECACTILGIDPTKKPFAPSGQAALFFSGLVDEFNRLKEIGVVETRDLGCVSFTFAVV